MTDSIWTDARTAELLRLNALKISGAAMARELSNGVAVTRSAVIGKLHRMGIPMNSYSRHTNDPKVSKPKIKPFYRPVAARVVAAAIVPLVVETHPDEPAPFNIHILKLREEHCRWPIDATDGAVFYCGHPKKRGSYCLHHAWRSVA